jgi:hypothetical protein
VADGGGLENRYGVTPIVGSNPTPSARSSGPPDTPCRDVADGMTERRFRPFSLVSVRLVDKAPQREPGHRPRTGPLATIR